MIEEIEGHPDESVNTEIVINKEVIKYNSVVDAEPKAKRKLYPEVVINKLINGATAALAQYQSGHRTLRYPGMLEIKEALDELKKGAG